MQQEPGMVPGSCFVIAMGLILEGRARRRILRIIVMAKKKKPIALKADEDALLRKLYKQWRIPRGQLKSHPDYLAEFVKLWNKLSGRSDPDSDVLHYIETQQKKTKRLPEPWPVFDGAHKRLPPVNIMMSVELIEVLRDLYLTYVLPLKIGTDSLSYRDELVQTLSDEFARRTGHHVPGILLAAKIENERKRRRWFTLRDHAKDDDLGFSDLHEIG